MLKELRRLFLVGIFATAPLALTLYIVLAIFRWFDDLFQPLVHPFVSPYFNHPIPGLGIVLGTFFLLVVGVVAPSLVGKQVILLAEKLVERVPLAKLVYSGSKQIFDSFSTSNTSKFDRVVMVQFPHPGMYAIGFVTREFQESLAPSIPDKKLAVFVPTTPNPTGGYLVFVAEKDAIHLKMSVEEGLKMVISVGLASRPVAELSH